ncbi:MAG: hypothetical protein ACFFDN_32250 [Candidatus Hodarchaeota archaeon]
MVVIVVETWHPPGKSEEIVKKHAELLKEFPEETLAKRILLCARLI